jgi:hypothetical protein
MTAKNKKVGRSQFVKAQVPVVKHTKSEARYLWGSNDLLPQEFLRAISDSGTATSCVSRLRSFVYGNGFIADATKALQVNKDQTANALLSDISYGVGVFEALSLRVLFRADGEIGSVYRVPFKLLRRADNGDWIYNKWKGDSRYKKADDVTIPTYNPRATPEERIAMIAEQMQEHGKQLGQILVDFEVKDIDGGDVYPMPDAYAGLEDIETDAALQRLDRRNVKKGFKAQTIIGVPGELDRDTEDEEGMTEQERFNNDLQQFVSEEGKSVFVIESKNPGESVTVDTLDIAPVLNATDDMRDKVSRSVCRHFSVPPVLIGMEVSAVLGNQQALVNSMKIFIETVSQRQEMIERVMKVLYPIHDFTIGKKSLFEYLPNEVLAKLTDDELRAMAGYAPLEKNTPSEQEQILNTLNTLSPLLAAEIVKRMPDEELFKLVGLKITTEPNG